MSSFTQPKALFFDVFGTCVDWRTSVTNALWEAAKEALDSPAASLSDVVRAKASDMTYEQWGDFAQEWRNTYLHFTRSIAKDPSIPYKTVDQHYHDALQELLLAHGLVSPDQDDGSLWTASQLDRLSRIWHSLDPWPDVPRGLHLLNKSFSTVTLSNGNVSLLTDMLSHAGMPFTHVFSAEMWRSYKPHPSVYLGAAERMGLQPAECMMVAAHLDDLKAAKACGFSTLYVERAREERCPELVGTGVEDVWIGIGEEGFVAAARKLGVDVGS